MVLLIDTNVLIDCLGHRVGFEQDARKVFSYCTLSSVQSYVAFHSLPNVWYALRKEPEKVRREALKAICNFFTVIATSHDEVVAAIEQIDFKDCLQDRCAKAAKADYIITRNVKDFKNSITKAITPADFCKQFIDA